MQEVGGLREQGADVGRAAMWDRIETICWTCQRGPRSGCAWFARHKPVPGWTAVRRDVLVWDGRAYTPSESYRVAACPLYLEDRREQPQPKWDGPYWDAPVCRGCYLRKVCMEVKGTCNRRAKC